MNFLKTYYEQIIKFDITNKFKLTNNTNVTKIKKITLNFGCKNFSIQKFATTILALEMIATKKARITTAKNPNLLLKIQKGQPSGCKVILKNKEIYAFLTKLHLEILPKLKNFEEFNIGIQSSSFSFRIPSDKIMLKEFENHYPLFANLPNLDVHISTSAQSFEELLFLIKSFKFPGSKTL